MKIAKSFFDAAKPWWNVELYQHEQKALDKEKDNDEHPKNTFYDEIARRSRETGVVWVPPQVQEALDNAAKAKQVHVFVPSTGQTTTITRGFDQKQMDSAEVEVG